MAPPRPQSRVAAVACARCRAARVAAPRPARRLLVAPPAAAPPPGPPGGRGDAGSDPDADASPLLGLSLALIAFYRREVSPLLPKSCRFLPTCSDYAQQAYTKYGVGKGFALTAWRIARCTPWGGSGYDPVRWPPPGLEWAFGGSEEGGEG
jgi:hypothetical protein